MCLGGGVVGLLKGDNFTLVTICGIAFWAMYDTSCTGFKPCYGLQFLVSHFMVMINAK